MEREKRPAEIGGAFFVRSEYIRLWENAYHTNNARNVSTKHVTSVEIETTTYSTYTASCRKRKAANTEITTAWLSAVDAIGEFMRGRSS
jgi:hypothetical protein